MFMIYFNHTFLTNMLQPLLWPSTGWYYYPLPPLNRRYLLTYDHSKITPTQITEYDNNIHSNPQLKPTLETNSSINHLDLLLQGTNQVLVIDVYRNTTSTDKTIHYNSYHPTEHKLASYWFLPNRLHQLPLTPPYKPKEWNMIQHLAKASVFPHTLLTKLNKQLSQNSHYYPQKIRHLQSPQPQQNMGHIYLLYEKQQISFRSTNLRITFRTNKAIHNILHNRPCNTNIHAQSAIYQLIFHTCNLSYIGQTRRRLDVRFKEHTRYIISNPQTAYALHILHTAHEYRPTETTTTLLHSPQ
jgi:hypothetical protein